MDRAFIAALWSMFVVGCVLGYMTAAFVGLVGVPLTCAVIGHHAARDAGLREVGT